MTRAELSVGPLVARTHQPRAARQAHLQQAETDFDPIPFDAAARAYDAMLAATALATNVSAAAPSPPTDRPALGGVPAQEQELLNTLSGPSQSPALLLLAVLLSAVTPGHGKALLASHLVGSRGTVRHALFLGAGITITHTISVIAIGIVALVAGQLIVPQLLVPALEIASGLLVVGLGARLVWTRWRSLRNEQAHDHDHEHHDHEHAHPHLHSQPGERVSSAGDSIGSLSTSSLPLADKAAPSHRGLSQVRRAWFSPVARCFGF